MIHSILVFAYACIYIYTLFQIGDVRNFYHFTLLENEKSAMKTDSPYFSKSKDLLSEKEVSKNIIILVHVCCIIS